MAFWWNVRGAFARIINLDLTHAQVHYARELERTLQPGAAWLDIGCGRQIVPDWAVSLSEQAKLAARASTFVGVDTDAAILQHPLLRERVIGLGGSLPFRDAVFDLVTANMVVEHVPAPREFLADIARVLRPGGRFLFLTPNYQHYMIRIAALAPDGLKKKIVYVLEDRAEEDVFPTHYRMNTVAAVRESATRCGFAIDRLDVTGSIGAFPELGPIGVLECLPMKLAASVGGGRYNSNLIAVLSRNQIQPRAK